MEGSSKRTGRRWAWILVPYVLHIALRLAISWPLDVPLKGDELGYLSNARVLATGSGVVDPIGRTPYKAGYSLFLVPAFWATSDPLAAFKGVQVLNAFLLSLVYPAAFVLAGRFRPDTSDLDRALLAGCVACYPAAILYATTAMGANLFIPLFFGVVIAAQDALTRDDRRSWMLFGLAGSYLYAVHERALGILALTVLAAVVTLIRKRGRNLAPVWALAAVPAVLLTMRWLSPPGSRWETGSKSTAIVVRALLDLKALAVTFCGQLWYLGLATCGVLFAGSLYLAFTTFRTRGDRWRSAPLLFAYGSAASVFVISVLFMAQRPGARFTHWIYGRYNEGVLLPVLVLGLVALREVRWKKAYAVSCIAAAGLLGSLFLGLKLAWTPAAGPAFSFNASSITLLSRIRDLGFLPAMAVLGALFAALCWALCWRWRWGIAGLTAFFLLSTGTTYATSWVERYRTTAEQHELVRLLERIDPQPGRVALDRVSRPYHFHYYNMTYLLPSYEFVPFPSWAKPPSPLVLSRSRQFGRRYPRARLAGLENHWGAGDRRITGLWVLPGELQDDLAGRGLLVPAGFPRPLTSPELRSEIRPLAVPAAAGIRRKATLELEVTNRSSIPWPHRAGWKRPEWSVRIAGRWQGREGEPVWADLPRMLYPGESAVVRMTLDPQAGGLPPGRHLFTVAVAQFPAHGRSRQFLEVPLDVTPVSASAGRAPSSTEAASGPRAPRTATGRTAESPATTSG